MPVQAELHWRIYSVPDVGTNSSVGLSSVAYGNGRYVAVSDAGDVVLARAENPAVWTHQQFSDTHLKQIAFGNGRFVTAGEFNSRAVLLVSTNGEEWVRSELPTQGFHGIAYGNGQFIAIGQDVVAASRDGREWTFDTQFVRTPAAFLIETYFVNGSFIINLLDSRDAGGVFPPTRLAISEDGATWEEHLFYDGMRNIVYGRHRYMSLSFTDCVPCGSLLVSNDPTNWVYEPLPTRAQGYVISYGNGTFAILGEIFNERTGEPTPVILSSQDTDRWDIFALGSQTGLGALTFGANRFVAVGGRTVAVSEEGLFEPLITSSRISGDALELELDAEQGTTCQVERSEDLKSWAGVGVIDVQEERANFRSSETATRATGFFRVKRVQ